MDPSLEMADSPHGYEDRKTSLVVFGVLTLIIGLICGLFVPLMIVGQSMAPQGSAGSTSHTILPATMLYLGLAVVFIWLGIGSMMARRWARALLLVLSASWLAIGVFSMGFMIFLLPKIMASINAAQHPAGQPAMPPEMTSVFMVMMLLFMAVIYVVIPGAWVLFYRSRHVKATCEALDPVVRWTDRAPLPVIAMCLWLAVTSASMVLMVVAYKGVIPFFGLFVAGLPGAVLYILAAVIFAYSARQIYMLRWSGWWLVLTCVSLFAVSAFMTYSHHTIDELYELMGYSDQELAQIRQFNFLKGDTLRWASLCGMIPFVGYLLYLRRYFPGGKADASGATGDSQ
jgi:hypothetical protein